MPNSAMAKIADLRRLHQAATPGPWRRGEEYDADLQDVVPDKALHGPTYIQESLGANYEVSDTVCVFGFSAHRRHEDNLKFVASAQSALPGLLDIAAAAIPLLAALDQLPYANLSGCECIDAIGQLRAAISKLTGGNAT